MQDWKLKDSGWDKKMEVNKAVEKVEYSSVIVVRRYTCFEKTSLMQKRLIQHEGILNIFGLHPNTTLQLTQAMQVLKYKLTCNCSHCFSLIETVKSRGLIVEPVMKGVSLVFNFLGGHGYKLKSTSTLQNPDGSNSSHWVWVKAEVFSDI